MQFEKSSGLNVDHAESLNAMQQTAREVTEAYRSLLQSMVDAGSGADPNDYVPTPTILSKVRDQFTGLEANLRAQRETNQDIVTGHFEAVQNCNNERATAFHEAMGVQARVLSMQNARDTHSACREQEDTDIGAMEDECGAFETLKGKCEDTQWTDQNWFAAAKTQQGALHSIVGKAVECRAKVKKVTDQAAICDGNQEDFEAAFCAYEKKLTETCNEYNRCYTNAASNKVLADASITKLMNEQQTMWNMIQKVHCYLDLLDEVKPSQGTAQFPKQDRINQCNNLQNGEYNTDKSTYTSNDDKIAITFKAAEAREKCGFDRDVEGEKWTANELGHADTEGEWATSMYRPGHQDWYNAELQPYESHGKLKEVTGCSAVPV